MLYDMTYLWNLKNKNQSVQKEIRFMVTRDGRQREEELKEGR